MKEIGIVILARQTSTRLPGKIFLNINNKPIFQIVYEKLFSINKNIIYAIPNNSKNCKLERSLIKSSIPYVKCSENNVLKRFITASKKLNTKYIQRFNADNILFSLEYIKNCSSYVNNNYNIFTNINCVNHSGQSIEIIKSCLLDDIGTTSNFEKEHVFPFFYKKFSESIFNLPCPPNVSRPLDNLDDYLYIKTKYNDRY